MDTGLSIGLSRCANLYSGIRASIQGKFTLHTVTVYIAGNLTNNINFQKSRLHSYRYDSDSQGDGHKIKLLTQNRASSMLLIMQSSIILHAVCNAFAVKIQSFLKRMILKDTSYEIGQTSRANQEYAEPEVL